MSRESSSSSSRSSGGGGGSKNGRSNGGRSSDGRSGGRSGGGGSGGGRSDDRRGGSGKKGGGYKGRDSGRSAGRYDSRSTRPSRPLTEAEKRSKEVKSRRAPREPRNPDIERQQIEDRTTEVWIDEGSVRDAALGATERAGAVTGPSSDKRREPKPLDPEVTSEMVDILGQQRGARLAERLAQASEALDRERFQEARRITTSIAKETPSVAAVHEVLGLACYRLGKYKQAASELELAQELYPNPSMLPILADSHRAQSRWSAVDRVWGDLCAASPPHDVMAEGRIVAAGALADQGDLAAAIALMSKAKKAPKAVREHHLRQWYVLADLYDRLGDPINARQWFSKVAQYDSDYEDVQQRLRSVSR
jgi:hypothetical protein